MEMNELLQVEMNLNKPKAIFCLSYELFDDFFPHFQMDLYKLMSCTNDFRLKKCFLFLLNATTQMKSVFTVMLLNNCILKLTKVNAHNGY